MSRAFVREGDDVPEALPERAISPHPNLVTARGARLIDERVRELEQRREEARRAEDKAAIARAERDLRYWQHRKHTAQVMEPERDPERVGFGTRVTLIDAAGEQRVFTLVGEDEADPAAGLISWVAPVARALLGCAVGDEVSLPGRRAEIAAIEAPPRVDL